MLHRNEPTKHVRRCLRIFWRRTTPETTERKRETQTDGEMLNEVVTPRQLCRISHLFILP